MFPNQLDTSQKIWIIKEVGEWKIGYLTMGIRRWEKSIDCSKCPCVWWRRFLDPQGWRQSLEQIQFGHGKVCFNKLGTQRISLFTALKNTSSYSIWFYRHLLEAGSWGIWQRRLSLRPCRKELCKSWGDFSSLSSLCSCVEQHMWVRNLGFTRAPLPELAFIGELERKLIMENRQVLWGLFCLLSCPSFL